MEGMTPTPPESDEITPEIQPEINEEITPEPPAFEPDLTYKFKGEEHHISEDFKDFITNEERNKTVRELYEKAAGLDFMKGSRDHYKTQLEGIQGRMTELEAGARKASDINHFIEKGDMASALKVAGFTKDHVLNHAIALLEAEERGAGLPDSNAAIEARELQMQMEQSNKELMEAKTQLAFNEYSMATSAHQELINAYDARNYPGAFQRMVSLHGQQMSQQNPNYKITEAVNDLANQFSWILNGAPTAPQQQTTTNEQHTQTFPTVTTKTSSAASPVKKKITSMEDLMKAQKEAFA